VQATTATVICDRAGASPYARLLLARLALWSGQVQQGQAALQQLLNELQPMHRKRSARLLTHEVQLELAAALVRSDGARAMLLAQQTLSALVGDALQRSPTAVRALAIAAAAGMAAAPEHGCELGPQMLDPSFKPRAEQP